MKKVSLQLFGFAQWTGKECIVFLPEPVLKCLRLVYGKELLVQKGWNSCVRTWEPQVTIARRCRFPGFGTPGSQPVNHGLPLQATAGYQRLALILPNLATIFYHCKELPFPKGWNWRFPTWGPKHSTPQSSLHNTCSAPCTAPCTAPFTAPFTEPCTAPCETLPPQSRQHHAQHPAQHLCQTSPLQSGQHPAQHSTVATAGWTDFATAVWSALATAVCTTLCTAQHPAQHLCETSPPQSGQHPAGHPAQHPAQDLFSDFATAVWTAP